MYKISFIRFTALVVTKPGKHKNSYKVKRSINQMSLNYNKRNDTIN